jgi:hypothetical protein
MDTTKKTKNSSSKNQSEEDWQIKKELLALAKSGAPRPQRGTRLGNALRRFTTPPTKKKTSERPLGINFARLEKQRGTAGINWKRLEKLSAEHPWARQMRRAAERGVFDKNPLAVKVERQARPSRA